MVARIIGGALAGWLLGLTPLALLDALSLTSSAIDPSATALVGVVALAVGIALGGAAAGLIGGQRMGAVAGAIAGALVAASLIALMSVLGAQGALPNLLALHPVRRDGAALFIGVLVASVALGVSALMGLRGARAEAASVAAFAAAQSANQRQQAPAAWTNDPRAAAPGGYGGVPSRPSPRDPRDPRDPRASTPYGRQEDGWGADTRRGPPASGPRQPPRSDQRPAAARYDAREYDAREPGYEPRERWSDNRSERW